MTDIERRKIVAAAIKEYLRLGLSVIPVRAGEKKAACPWEPFAAKCATPAEWNEWWSVWPGCNLAVVLGGSRAPDEKQLVCVDTDSEAAEAWIRQQKPLPATPTVKTAKGWHRYFYAPMDRDHFGGAEGRPEVRAGVHYVVAPPSVHPSGAVYEWEDYLGLGTPVADLPPWGIDLMPVKGETRVASAKVLDGEKVREFRNNALSRKVYQWRKLDFPAEELLRLARAWNAEHIEPPLPDAEVCGCVRGKLKIAPDESPREAAAKGSAYAARDAEEAVNEASLMAEADAQASAVLECAVADAVDATPFRTGGCRLTRGVVDVTEVAAEIIGDIEERRNLPGGVYGLRTGFRSWDTHFGGFRTEQLILVGGKTGFGKTTFCRHCTFATLDAMVEEGSDEHLLVYLMEGSKAQFVRFYIGYKYGLPLKMLEPGGEELATDEQRDIIAQAYSDFLQWPLKMTDDLRDPADIIANICVNADNGPIVGAVVDNLQQFNRGGEQLSYYASVGACNRIAEIADKGKFPIMLMSQVKQRDGDTSAKGGGHWEEAASLVLNVVRGEKGQEREERIHSNITEINVQKRREGLVPATLRLRGDTSDAQTGRLMEEWEWNRLQGQAAGVVRERDRRDY